MTKKPPKRKPRNQSLKEKSNARLAAVQCLYRIKITQENTATETLISDVLDTWEDNRADDNPELHSNEYCDKSLLKKLVRGCVPEQDHPSSLIKKHLTTTWKLDRMSPLLVSILQCAVYEFLYHPQLGIPIIVDEYVAMTRDFFDDAEVSFVHGILHKLAGETRQ